MGLSHLILVVIGLMDGFLASDRELQAYCSA